MCPVCSSSWTVDIAKTYCLLLLHSSHLLGLSKSSGSDAPLLSCPQPLRETFSCSLKCLSPASPLHLAPESKANKFSSAPRSLKPTWAQTSFPIYSHRVYCYPPPLSQLTESFPLQEENLTPVLSGFLPNLLFWA